MKKNKIIELNIDFYRSVENQKSVPYDGKYLKPGSLVNKPNHDMSILDAIITRRTSRAYRKELVPYELFEWLVDISCNAPSSCNEQKWKIIYLSDKEILNNLYQRGSAAFLTKVNQAFILLYNNRTDNIKYQDHIQSGASFITTFSLLAHSVGVGSCWVCHIPNKSEIRRLFNIDRRFDPIALVTFGYYTNKLKPRKIKKDVENIISTNNFNFKNLIFSSQKKNIYVRRLLIFIYYLIPSFLRKKLRFLTKPYEKKFYYEISD